MTHRLYRLFSFHSLRSFCFQPIASRRLLLGAASAPTAVFLVLFAWYSPQLRPQEAADAASSAAIGCSPGSGGGGSGNSGTTPGTYTISVSGTSGTISATVGIIALTIQ